MRVSGNFNIPKLNFRGIHMSDAASPIVEKYLTAGGKFKDSYESLETVSDLHDDDIFIQKINNGNGLNFQAMDSFTQETKYYLAADEDPNKGIEKALDVYVDFVSSPKKLPKKPTPRRPQQRDSERPVEPRGRVRRRKFLGIF